MSRTGREPLHETELDHALLTLAEQAEKELIPFRLRQLTEELRLALARSRRQDDTKAQ